MDSLRPGLGSKPPEEGAELPRPGIGSRPAGEAEGAEFDESPRAGTIKGAGATARPGIGKSAPPLDELEVPRPAMGSIAALGFSTKSGFTSVTEIGMDDGASSVVTSFSAAKGAGAPPPRAGIGKPAGGPPSPRFGIGSIPP